MAGFEGESWASDAELRVAMRAGWHFTVLESLTYTKREGTGRNGPLYCWGEHLMRAEQKLRDAGQDPAGKMVQHILRHTIGWLSPTPKKRLIKKHVSEGATIPDTLEIELVDDFFYYKVPAEDLSPEWNHPEWTQQIWGKCRAAVTSYALGLPRDMIVAIDTDALYLTHTPPELRADDGKAGRFRVKRNYEELAPYHDVKTLRRAVRNG